MTVDTLLKFTLLDYLTYKTGCPYLSDLEHIPKWKIYYMVKDIPANAFSASCWMDAMNYICKCHNIAMCLNSEIIKKIFLKNLNEPSKVSLERRGYG